MKTFSLFTFMAFFTALGCQAHPLRASCNETDWFEHGRRDGSAGKPLMIDAHSRRCGADFTTGAENLFIQGYNNGLSEYCTPDNGFAIGKSGGRPARICPAPLDTHFFAAVKKGVKAREAEETN